MRQRSGFTLVELSIVLVIIGLLIGGILAAQSMIGTAKINAQVQQIGQFDAMVLNFKENYHYLPGDAPAFGGDGDGVIAGTASGGYRGDFTTFSCEIGNFWNNLMPEKYKGAGACIQPGIATQTNGLLMAAPLAKLGSENSFFIASAIGLYASCLTQTSQNYYAILNASQGKFANGGTGWYAFDTTTSSNSSLKPVDLLALDSKMDDGLANSGYVLSGSIGNCYSNLGGINSTPLATCSSGARYDLTHDTYECTPLIRIGGSVGIPQ